MENKIKGIEKILEKFSKKFVDHWEGLGKAVVYPLKEGVSSIIPAEDVEKWLRKELSALVREERRSIIEEIVAIEKRNIDEESDTYDFDSFAEDMILWLSRNKNLQKK